MTQKKVTIDPGTVWARLRAANARTLRNALHDHAEFLASFDLSDPEATTDMLNGLLERLSVDMRNASILLTEFHELLTGEGA